LPLVTVVTLKLTMTTTEVIMQTIEDKSVETAKLLLIDIEITPAIEKALHLCFKLGYLEGQYDMENNITPIHSKT